MSFTASRLSRFSRHLLFGARLLFSPSSSLFFSFRGDQLSRGYHLPAKSLKRIRTSCRNILLAHSWTPETHPFQLTSYIQAIFSPSRPPHFTSTFLFPYLPIRLAVFYHTCNARLLFLSRVEICLRTSLAKMQNTDPSHKTWLPYFYRMFHFPLVQLYIIFSYKNIKEREISLYIFTYSRRNFEVKYFSLPKFKSAISYRLQFRKCKYLNWSPFLSL